MNYWIGNTWKKHISISESKPIYNESIKVFMADRKQQNNDRKTNNDVNVFLTFLREIGETRQVKNTSHNKLVKLLSIFRH